MNSKLLIRKIQALLHDPPEKAIILGKIGHEGRAKEIIGKLIEEAVITNEVRQADHIASAADRINLPKDARFSLEFCKNPIIIHPLSGKQFHLEKLTQIEIENITSDVNEAIIGLYEKYRDNHEKLYLSLWRELSENLARNGIKSELGQLWELLPADTRIPDHSIWEHKKITSAIASALPKPAFLLFAIGPVQEFIATARKTQDLWAGSYLLSYLSWSAMKVVVEEFGPDSIIFPDLCKQPFVDTWLREKGLDIKQPDIEKLSSPTLPNRFFAIISENAFNDISNKAKKIVEETFRKICNIVKDKLAEKLEIKSEEWNRIWQRQSNNFIEAYYTSISINDYSQFIEHYKQLLNIGEEWEFGQLLKEYENKGFPPNIGTVYSQIYNFIEKTLKSRKFIRNFSQQEEPNHKCTLCGVREPIHPGTYNNKNCLKDFGALRGFWQEKILPAFPQIRKSERLCAVCITKRLSSNFYFKDYLGFNINDNFPSVSMVATASFKLMLIENLSNNDLRAKLGLFIDSIKALAPNRWSGIPLPMVIRACRDEISKDFARLEGDWLYKETLNDKKTLWEENEKKMTEEDFDNLLSTAKKKQKELFDTIKEIDKTLPIDKKIGSPSTYYAVLLMDGDNMGKWLSGSNSPKIEKILHPEIKNILDKSWDSLKNINRPLSPSIHLSISKALRDFSLNIVKEIVEKDHLGKIVYSGGDDVLAFVNLRDLLDVMRKLRAFFSGNIVIDESTSKIDINFNKGTGFIPVDEEGIPLNVGNNEKKIRGFMVSMGTNATASMGVVIAHHASNLSQVLDEVRNCEKRAKNLDCKNAFCIALSKRGGGRVYLSAKWFYNITDSKKGDNILETIPLLRKWADTFYHDYISPKFVYTFRSETKGLEGLPIRAISLELLRIADRQRNKKTKDFNKDMMDRLVEGLIKLYMNSHSLNEISNFLYISAFLGREENR